MINKIAPIALIVVCACGGGKGEPIGPGTPPSSDLSTMNVGEVRVFTPSEIQNGLDLPASSSARDYIVIVGNTNTRPDVEANYVVKADWLAGGSPGVASQASVSQQSGMLLRNINIPRTRQESLHRKIRGFERNSLALRMPSAAMGLDRFALRRNRSVSVAGPVPAVGDRIPIKIPDANTNNLCDNFITTQAVVASVSTRAILAVDTLDGPPLTLFTQAELDSITQEFDNVTYSTDVAYFGTPTDFDQNQGHIIILFTGQVNKLTPAAPPGSDAGFVGGFFFAGDFFPTTPEPGQPANTACAQSNRAEIFYLLSPDPTGRFGNVRTTSSVRQGTRGTIAHEFQHMINSGNRFNNPAADWEVTWLDEGLSHLAEDVVGRVQRGFGDLQTLTLSDLLGTTPAQGDDFDAFFYQNLARLSYWMANPDTSSGISARTDQNLSSRGAAWSLVRYAADNFSGSQPRVLAKKLAAGPDTGIKNFTSATNTPLDTLVAGWLVANYADHLGIVGLDPKYQFKSYNFRNVMPAVAQAVLNTSRTYPLKVQAIGSGSDNITAKNRTGTGTYYRLNVAANSGAKNVKILDAAGNVASFTGAHVYVLRVQ